MKKFLLMVAFFVLPVVAMEESSDSYDGGDESASFDDGRSERWTIGPGADESPKKGKGWRELMREQGIGQPESRGARLAREQRMADREERRARKKSLHRCCLPFFWAKK